MFTNAYQVGDVASVKIVKLMPFGAFAEVVDGVDGLIHISQIANRRIGKPQDELKVGQVVDAKITAIDDEKQKISLSIRALSEPEPADAPEEDEVIYDTSVVEPEAEEAVEEVVEEAAEPVEAAEEAPQE